jgi:Flp pilus assembly protein TadG
MKRHQKGATAVEFAFVALILITLVIGIMELGRIMFTWNAANEATRDGARAAVVCTVDTSKALVTARMQRFLPQLTSSEVVVEYLPSPSAVQRVRVAISGLTIEPVVPLFGTSIPVPASAHTLPSESLSGTAAESYLCDPSRW